MPAVLKGESRSQYVSRCVPIALKEAGTKDTAHAVAKCGGMWDQARKRRRITTNRLNPLRADPTRTATLRRLFEAELNRRFAVLKRKIRQLVVEEDAFGLARKNKLFVVQQVSYKYDEGRPSAALRGYDRQWRKVKQLYLKRWPWCRECLKQGKLVKATQVDHRKHLSGDHERFFDQRNWQSLCATHHSQKTRTNNITVNTRWAFRTTPAQVEAFQGWLRTQVEADMFTAGEQAYWRTYAEQGYRKGAGRAFDDTRVAQRAMLDEANAQQMAWYEGTKEEFLRSSFGRPVAIDKIKLLAGRTFTDLKSVTEDMGARITRQLTDGLVQGQNPTVIARRMIRDGIGTKVRGVQSRALTIARTEIIRAHAEGQLDAMEQLGVTKLGVMVEWATSGAFVCQQCAPLHGMVLTLKEARGMLPQHPNCRCAWIPANVGEDQKKPSTITVVTKPSRRLKSGKRTPAVTRKVTIPGQKRTPAEVQKAIDDSIRAQMPKIKKRTLAQQKARTSWAGADKAIAKRRPRSILDPTKPVRPRKPKPTPKLKPEQTFADLSVQKQTALVQARDHRDKLRELLKATDIRGFKKGFSHHITKGQGVEEAFGKWQGLMRVAVQKMDDRLVGVTGLPARTVKFRKAATKAVKKAQSTGPLRVATDFLDEKAVARGIEKPYVYQEGKPLKIYHVTDRKTAEKIKREGFKASAKNQFQGFASETQGTYGWADLDRAKFELSRMAETMAASADEAASLADDFVIIEIKVPKSRFKHLRPDEDFSLNPKDWKASLEEMKSVAVEGDLPASSIETIFVSKPRG